jgi:hypothetical protein
MAYQLLMSLEYTRVADGTVERFATIRAKRDRWPADDEIAYTFFCARGWKLRPGAAPTRSGVWFPKRGSVGEVDGSDAGAEDPTDSGKTAVAGEPRACPQCGTQKLREGAQKEYVVYLTCEQCRYLVTLNTPQAAMVKT